MSRRQRSRSRSSRVTSQPHAERKNGIEDLSNQVIAGLVVAIISAAVLGFAGGAQYTQGAVNVAGHQNQFIENTPFVSAPPPVPVQDANKSAPPPLFGSIHGRGNETVVDAPVAAMGQGQIAGSLLADGNITAVLLRDGESPNVRCPWEAVAVAVAGGGLNASQMHLTVEGDIKAVSFFSPDDVFVSAEELQASQALRKLCGVERSEQFLANFNRE